MSLFSQGKLFNNYHIKWVFFISMVIFEIGILISAVSPISTVFIIGRAITGLGFSGISHGCMVYSSFSSIQSSLTVNFQHYCHIKAIMAATNIYWANQCQRVFATAVAPLIGRAFISDLSWR
jgi:MFS family permease